MGIIRIPYTVIWLNAGVVVCLAIGSVIVKLAGYTEYFALMAGTSSGIALSIGIILLASHFNTHNKEHNT